MSDKPRLILSDQWVLAMAAALGIDGARIKRMVVDSVGPRHALEIYVEYWGDERVLTVTPAPNSAVVIGTAERPS